MNGKSFGLSCSLGMEGDSLNLSPFLDKLFREWRIARQGDLHSFSMTSAPVRPRRYYLENTTFVAILIEGRDQKKRPTEFGRNQALQPFDSWKFSFTKVRPEEVIFKLPLILSSHGFPINDGNVN